MIYQLALVSPCSIDLCPPWYATWDDHAGKERIVRRETLTGEDIGQNDVFRQQVDLTHVRDYLSVHILQVCRQIYQEAAHYFWGTNVWRFTDDEGWEILWRFLETIGPNARSMVSRIDVMAPFAIPDQMASSYVFFDWVRYNAKNRPKLHMIKRWEGAFRDDCYPLVQQIWDNERTLKELNLLIPGQHYMKSVTTGSLDWRVDRSMGQIPKIRVVVEPGDILYDKDCVLRQGWDLVAHAGCSLGSGDLATPRAERKLYVTEKVHHWEGQDDFPAGFEYMFESEDTSVHANRGRVTDPKRSIRVARDLKSFGPCMIRMENIYCRCYACIRGLRCYLSKDGIIGIEYRSIVDDEDRRGEN